MIILLFWITSSADKQITKYGMGGIDSMNSLLQRSNPIDQGVDPAVILSFIDSLKADKLEMHGFMLARHGHVIAEEWWEPYTPDVQHQLYSLSKSFTSIAVGFAISDGLLSINDPVVSFFPEYSTNLNESWSTLSVRHLLTMSTGHQSDTSGVMRKRTDGDWVAAFFEIPLSHKPGSCFIYNSGATYLLSVIVSRLAKMRLVNYLRPRLFEPLGIENPVWQQCPRNYDVGGWGLMLKTEDIAKFGLFLLQRGRWDSKQLISSSWIDEATRKQIDNTGHPDPDWSQGYGYQFWRCTHNFYRGDGAHGQFCIVMPACDAVIAINAKLNDMQDMLTRIWQTLIPAMTEAAVGVDRPNNLNNTSVSSENIRP